LFVTDYEERGTKKGTSTHIQKAILHTCARRGKLVLILTIHTLLFTLATKKSIIGCCGKMTHNT